MHYGGDGVDTFQFTHVPNPNPCNQFLKYSIGHFAVQWIKQNVFYKREIVTVIYEVPGMLSSLTYSSLQHCGHLILQMK